jgi:hypothetical protein
LDELLAVGFVFATYLAGLRAAESEASCGVNW